MFKTLFLCLLCCCSVNLAFADCLLQTKTQQLVAGYPQKSVQGLGQVSSLDEAYCIQQHYVSLLTQKSGEVAGYKIGFTGKASQTRFNMSGPATGVLLNKMFLADKSVVSRDFGFRPLIEPDFMVVINDSAIMQAKSARETLAYIGSVHPLLELPAVRLHPDEPMSGYSLVALNIAATYMVVGEGVQVENSEVFFQALGEIQTVFSDNLDNELQTAGSETLMGHPLNALFWLVEIMRSRGESLKSGDKISLGATGKLFPIQAKGYKYVFEWPTGASQSVSVSFQ